MGFCSEECFEKAKQDLLIKDLEWDEFDYQAVRDAIKNDPLQEVELKQKATDHLSQELGSVVFNHKVSQKETVIFQD